MFRNDTAEGRGGTGGGSPCRSLVAVPALSPTVGSRPRPLAAFLAQLATSDAPPPARALRAPEALRRYAATAALTGS